METEPFNEQLRYYRNQIGLSQEELAEKLGYTSRWLRTWESTDPNKPSHRDLIFKIVEIFVDGKAINSIWDANNFLFSCDFKPLSQTEIDKLKKDNPAFAEIEQNESTNDQSIAVQIFPNIWYKDREERLYSFWRRLELGTLFVKQGQMRFEYDRETLLIVNKDSVESIKHVSLKGDLNANWVECVFLEDGKEKTIWFSEARWLGIGNLIGGSHKLFSHLWGWIYTE